MVEVDLFAGESIPRILISTGLVCCGLKTELA